MKTQLRLLVACASLALAGLAFSGCGNDCATGTSEADGECAVAAQACGAGTKLANGKCTLDTSGCGEGSSLQEGVCVANAPTGEECGDGTMFDTATGKCVPNEVIECGPNTTKENGKCIPAATVCTNGTMLNADNQCVVAAPACSVGTQLDPNTGKCAVTDQVCGANTAFDTASNTCKPTATVCATGTTFSGDTNLCLPDATCQVGDVIVDGKCLAPLEALFAATATEGAENDDPSIGGTANAVTLPAIGMTTAIKGIIDAPSDLDGDNVPDQDIDAFKFTGTVGQHIEIDLGVLNGPSLGYIIAGPNNWVRTAPLGAKQGASRTILLPFDGDYTVMVAPASVIQSEGAAGPLGDASWRYVLQVGAKAAITPVEVNTDNVNITGAYSDLTDNFYKLTNLTGGEIVDVTVKKQSSNATGVVQVWSSPTNYLQSFSLGDVDSTFSIVLPSPDAFLFVDWTSANGPQLDYEIEVKAKPGQTSLGTLPAGGTVASTAQNVLADEVRYFTITLAAGEALELSQTNVEGEEIDLIIKDDQGDSVYSRTFFDDINDSAPDVAYVYSANGGNYVIEATSQEDITDFVVTANSLTPADAGSFMFGGTLNITNAAQLDNQRRSYNKVNFSTGAIFDGSVLGGAGETTPDFKIYNAATGEVVENFTFGLDAANFLLPAGDYIFEVFAASELTTGYVIDFTLSAPPVFEVEPNNDAATATPIDLAKLVVGDFTDADLDVFKFTLAADQPADETQVFHVLPNGTGSATIDYTCTVKDSAGVVVSSVVEKNDCVVFLQGLLTGDYTLEISTTSTTKKDYVIASDIYTGYELDVEPNDTSATAQTIAPNFKVLGSVAEPTSEDWYSFTYTETPNASFIITLDLKEDLNEARGTLNKDSTTSVEMTVYDDTDTEIGSSQEGFLLSDTPNLPALTNGSVYKVKVSRASSAGFTGRYELTGQPKLFPPLPAPYQSAPALAIVDNDPAAAVSDIINVPTSCIVTDIIVDMNISHTWQGDILLDLTSPTGTTVRLWNGTGGSVDDVIGVFGQTLASSGALSGFYGADAMGDWTISVGDDGNGDTGTLNNWGLSFLCQ